MKTITAKAYLTNDPSAVTDSPELICRGTEKTVRRAAAAALGMGSLRGLAQSPTEEGVRYYAAGADDYSGASVEIVYDGD